jgi:ABC-type glycerol-3-phosphate transport system substrate-binding protein
MKRMLSLVVLLLVLLLMVSGCGGGGDVQPEAEPVEENSEAAQEEQEAETEEPAEEESETEEETESETEAETEEEEEEEAGDADPEADEEAEEMTLPAELTTAHDFNKFATDLMIEKVPANIFVAPVFSEEQEEEARQALVLIIAAYDEAINLYDQNEHFYYNRGRAYAHLYLDSDDPAYKELALADFEKALSMGLAMAQKEIDALQN